MSAIGAFLQGFVATSMEEQKRQQEQKQFDQTLALHQAALVQQQQRFDQDQALKEQERQDRLAQEKVANQLATFNAKREGALAQSLIEERKTGATAKAEQEANRVQLEATRQKSTAAMLETKNRIIDLQGEDPTGQKPEIQARIQGLQKIVSDQESELAAFDKRNPLDQAQQAQAQPQPQSGAGPLGQSPPQTPAPANASNASEPPQAVSGQAPPSYLTGHPDMAPAPQGQPAAPAAAPAAKPQAQAQAQPQAQQPGTTGHMVPPKDLEKEAYDTPEERDARNHQLKEMHLDNVKVAVLKSDLSEQDAKIAKARAEKVINESRLAEMPQYRGQVEDALYNRGLEDKVGLELVPKGTKTKSSRLGIRIGRIFGGAGATAGSTSGQSGEVFPEAEFKLKPQNAAEHGQTPLAVAQAFEDQVKAGGTVGEVYLEGAQDDLVRGVARTIPEQYRKTDQPVQVQPFDGLNNPTRHKAAVMITNLQAADNKLVALSQTGLEPTVLPKVVDAPTSIPGTLQLFTKAVDDKLSGALRNYRPHSGEGETISELATRMKPDQPDGTYSPEAQQAAKAALQNVDKASVSDTFKMDAHKVLDDIANPQEAAKNEANFKAMAKKAFPGKPTSEAEPQQGTPSGVPGMRGQLTMAALGGLSDFGAQKAAQQTAPQDVADANKAWGTIGPNTKDKETLAKTAVSDVSSAYGRMTQTEQTQAQSTWKAKRKIWKDQYKIPTATLKDMNEAVGLDRDDGL